MNKKMPTKRHYFDSYTSDVTESRRFINTPSRFAKNHLFYVQETGELQSLKPHKSNRQSIDSFLIVIVLNGEGTFHFEGKNYKVKENDLLFLNCNKSYYHISDKENSWNLKWLHFNGPSVLQYFEFFYHKNNSIKLKTESFEVFHSYLEQLNKSSNKNSKENEFEISNIITQLLTDLIQIENNVQSLSHHKATFNVEQLKKYLDENYKHKISLDNLSEHFYISKYHMSREFKKNYGMTINQYIAIKKITYAKELLRFSDLSVYEIGQEVENYDTSYFIKCFKKLEGLTPLEFRKKWTGT